MPNDQPNDDIRPPGHEPLEVDTRAVWIFAGVLVATIVLSLAFIGWLLWFLSSGRSVPMITDATDEATPRATTIPDLDANQLGQLRRLRLEERELLTGYSWVDSQAGIARIPIDRAMQIVAERGLEAVAFPAAATTTQTEAVTGQPPAAAEGEPNE